MIKQWLHQRYLNFMQWWRRFLFALLQFHHQHFRFCPVIAITGSCGKTTAKDLLYHILSTRWRGVKTPGTFNGFYTHAKTLLKLVPGWHRFAVMELGTMEPGKIDFLAKAIRPDIGLVLNIGLDHFRAFRNREAVADEKMKLIEMLPADGLAILNADEPLIMERFGCARANIMTFGISARADLRVENISSAWPERLSFDIITDNQRYPVNTQLCGAMWITSIAPAMVTARHMGMSIPEIIKAVESFEGSFLRMTPVSMPDHVTFILDDWKAPVWSIERSIEFLASARTPRKILVLGTISDSSDNGSKRYNQIIRRLGDHVDFVIVAGGNSKQLEHINGKHDPTRVMLIHDLEQASDTLRNLATPGTLVLIKGTTKQDHLHRLMYNHIKKISCWSRECRLYQSCRNCPELYKR